jgi:type I restriction enzyme M protein
VADLLRGDYKQSEYGKVILPFTVLRRLDCVLEPTKKQVLEKLPSITAQNIGPMVNRITGQTFYNTSKYDFISLKNDPNNIAANLINYINGFSPNAKEIIDYFSFNDQITRLDSANLLYLVVGKFTEIDLHPDKVSNIEMGYIFEELIRKFSEISNETAGEHFTPREVIRLMVHILFNEDSEVLARDGIVRTMYDPACGTGGMLSVAQEYLQNTNSGADLEVFGQELNPESYAICKADMIIKGCNPQNIRFGNSFSQDGLSGEKFDYMLSNPPFGVEWKKVEKEIRDENEKLGFAGRFGAGLPRISDGSLLFLQHMIAKMKQEKEGSRIGIVFNGSPLFTGDAGSGESEIRRWIIENDWLETIIALPDQLFYNTGISTYIWIVTNRKNKLRQGKIQLINAVDSFVKMRKSLGNKRNEISKEQMEEIVRIYGDYQPTENSKIFDNEDFGYRKIVVERPLRLNFQVSEEQIKELWNQTAFGSLATSKKKGEAGLQEMGAGKKQQVEIIRALESMDGRLLYKDREVFIKALKQAFKNSGVDLTANVLKVLLTALGERNETAEICRDAKGNPEADPELRDTENVPLKEDIQVYFDREVRPHVPDAWIDESKTKVGYEIPFTRHFYKYQPLRPSEEILKEIIQLEQSIQEKLRKVIGNG